MLSGYLVTQVLLRDLDGPDGRVGFARFYSRRMRRLLPASVAAIVVTAAVYGAVAPRGALEAATDSMQAALLYVANWYFIAESADYFAPDSPSPVLHFWSLAVEEQFYFVWPLLLTGLWRATRRRRRVVAACAGVGALASFGLMLAMHESSPTRAYFGTDTRAYQLLVGAALALLPGVVDRARGHRAARLLAPLGLVGIVAIASSVVDQGPFARGAVATAAALALIVGVEAHDRSPVAGALSLRPIAYLGTISYATYLWHWPVILVIGELGVTTSATTLALLTALLATGIAALSSELLELPIRRAPSLDRHRRAVVAGGLAVSVLAAALVVPPLLDFQRARVTSPETSTLADGTPVPEDYDQQSTFNARYGETVDCTGAPATDCTVVDGDGTHVLLIGDSNALMYVPALTELARAEGLRLSLAVLEGCPWQLGFTHLTDAISERCRQKRPDTYERLLPELRPDVVVLINTRLWAGNGPDSSAEPAATLARATDDSLDRIEATGAAVVLVAPSPASQGRVDPLECLATASFVEACAFQTSTPRSWLDEHLRERADASEQVRLFDWGPLICPRLPTCDAMLGGVPVFWNAEHITSAYSESLAGPIGRDLAAHGIIPPLTVEPS